MKLIAKLFAATALLVGLNNAFAEGRKEATANESLRPGQEPQRKHYRALFQALKNLQDPDTEA